MTPRRRLTPGEWTAVAAGAVLLVASLLPWYSLPHNVVLDGYAHRTFTAWSGGLAPTTLLPLVVGVAVAVPLLLARLADLHLPERLGGMQCSQLRVVVAVGGAVVALCELATRRAWGPAALSRGPGLWVTVLGAAALLVGVLIDLRPGSPAAADPVAEPDRTDP